MTACAADSGILSDHLKKMLQSSELPVPGADNRPGSRDVAAVVLELILFTVADPRRQDVIDEGMRNGALQFYKSMFAVA